MQAHRHFYLITKSFADIIFLRAWYTIHPRKFYNPVTSLLVPPSERNAMSSGSASGSSGWVAMRLTGEVRRAEGLKTPNPVNSIYKKVERPERRFNKLVIPKKLQAALPYASKPKLMRPKSKETYMQKRAVVMEPEEKKAVALMQQMRALRKDQVKRRHEKKSAKREEKMKELRKKEEWKEEKEKSRRKEGMKSAGMKRQRDREREEGGGRRKKKRTE